MLWRCWRCHYIWKYFVQVWFKNRRAKCRQQAKQQSQGTVGGDTATSRRGPKGAAHTNKSPTKGGNTTAGGRLVVLKYSRTSFYTSFSLTHILSIWEAGMGNFSPGTIHWVINTFAVDHRQWQATADLCPGFGDGWDCPPVGRGWGRPFDLSSRTLLTHRLAPELKGSIHSVTHTDSLILNHH